MHRTTATVLASLALVSVAAAETFTIRPQFTQGRHVEVEVARRRADRGRKFVASSTVVIDVIRVDDSGAVLTFASGPTTISGAPAEVRRALEAVDRVTRDVVMEARFDSDGVFGGVENEAEVIEAVQRGMDEMMRALAERAPTATMQQVRAAIQGMVTPTVAIDSATELVQLYFGMAGVDVTPGKGERAQVELPSPFGGSLDADVEMRVVQMDPGLEQAVLRVESRPTPESATEAAAAAVRRFAPEAAGAQFEAALARMRLSIADRAEYVLDLPTHWMRSVDFARTSNVNGVQRVDQTTIRITRVGPQP